ncbi:MAG: hypothetical protein CSA97_04885, partial [Bacteroidetes bacterium]
MGRDKHIGFSWLRGLLVMLVLLGVGLPGWAAEIGDKFQAGILFYEVTSLSPREVKTVGQHSKLDDNDGYWAPNYFKGHAHLVIPAEVQGPDGQSYSVTEIGDDTFRLGRHIQRVELPQTLRTIGARAFQQCFHLFSINFPASLERIGELAFAYWLSLRVIVSEVANPAALQVGNDAFKGLDQDACVIRTPPGKRDEYVAAVWNVFSKVTESPQVGDLIVRDGVNYLAYFDSEMLVVPADDPLSIEGDVQVPEYIEYEGKNYYIRSIAKYAFMKARNLKSIKLPGALVNIGEEAFYYSGLRQVEFSTPSSLRSIGRSAFMSCTELSLVLPDGLETIESRAFYNSRIEHIELPPSLASIGEEAFDETYLRLIVSRIEDPASITMGDRAFHVENIPFCVLRVPDGKVSSYSSADQWKDFMNITSDEDAGREFTKGNMVYRVTMPGEIALMRLADEDAKPSGTLELPRNIEDDGKTYVLAKIFSDVFASSKELLSISFPSSLRYIETRAFSKCSALRQVKLPSSLEYIGWMAFSYCSNLRKVELNGSLRTIGGRAFSDCPKLGLVVSSIGGGSLGSVKQGRGIFEDSKPEDCVLRVPTGSEAQYQATEQWKDFGVITEDSQLGGEFVADDMLYRIIATNEVILLGVPEGKEQPSGQLTIPASVSHSGAPYNVVAIAGGAFRACKGLQQVALPESLRRVGREAFEACSALQRVELPEGLLQVDKKAFHECTGLLELRLPASLARIHRLAFADCTRLGLIVANMPDPAAVELDDYPFAAVDRGSCVLQIPGGTAQVNLYKVADVWKEFIVTDDAQLGREFYSEGLKYRVIGDNTVYLVPVDEGETKPSGSVVIPEKVDNSGTTYTVIGVARYTFTGCEGLERVELPSALDLMGASFDMCHRLNTITSQVYLSPSSTFKMYGWLDVDFSSCILRVPAGLVDSYKAADVWKKFKHILPIDASPEVGEEFTAAGVRYRILGDARVAVVPHEFGGAAYAGNLVIPASVEHGGTEYAVVNVVDRAFLGCEGLERLELPATIERVGYHAFEGCSGLSVLALRMPDPTSVSWSRTLGMPDDKPKLQVPAASLEKYKNWWFENGVVEPFPADGGEDSGGEGNGNENNGSAGNADTPVAATGAISLSLQPNP